MIEYKCPIQGCDHAIEDGQHVDDVANQLRQHYRAQHPNKAFFETRAKEQIESFNMSLEDALQRNYGYDWANRYQPQQVLPAVRQIVLPDNADFYCQALIKEANEYLENNGNPADAANPADQDEVAVQPVNMFNFPNPGRQARGRW